MIQVLIMFNSKESKQFDRYARQKGLLFDVIKENGFKYEKKTDFVLTMDRVNYHFLDLAKRNLKKFFETYTDFKHVFAFVNVLKPEEKELLSTIFNPEQVVYNFGAEDLFQPYKDTYEKVQIFYLDYPGPTKVLKKEIYEYEFRNKGRFEEHYRTKEEAYKKLKSICEERIQSNTRQLAIIQKRIEDDKKMLEKLQKY